MGGGGIFPDQMVGRVGEVGGLGGEGEGEGPDYAEMVRLYTVHTQPEKHPHALYSYFYSV